MDAPATPPTPAPAPRLNSRRTWIIAAVSVALIAGGTVFGIHHHNRGQAHRLAEAIAMRDAVVTDTTQIRSELTSLIEHAEQVAAQLTDLYATLDDANGEVNDTDEPSAAMAAFTTPAGRHVPTDLKDALTAAQGVWAKRKAPCPKRFRWSEGLSAGRGDRI